MSTTTTKAVALKDAKPGDAFSGTFNKGKPTQLAVAGTIQDFGYDHPCVHSSLPYVDGDAWSDVYITRTETIITNYDRFLEYPIGTIFEVVADDTSVWVKTQPNAASLVTSDHRDWYLDNLTDLPVRPYAWGGPKTTLTVIYPTEVPA